MLKLRLPSPCSSSPSCGAGSGTGSAPPAPPSCRAPTRPPARRRVACCPGGPYPAALAALRAADPLQRDCQRTHQFVCQLKAWVAVPERQDMCLRDRAAHCGKLSQCERWHALASPSCQRAGGTWQVTLPRCGCTPSDGCTRGQQVCSLTKAGSKAQASHSKGYTI